MKGEKEIKLLTKKGLGMSVRGLGDLRKKVKNLARLQRHKERVGMAGEGLQYRVHIYQANAADYGIPQQRHRVFLSDSAATSK